MKNDVKLEDVAFIPETKKVYPDDYELDLGEKRRAYILPIVIGYVPPEDILTTCEAVLQWLETGTMPSIDHKKGTLVKMVRNEQASTPPSKPE